MADIGIVAIGRNEGERLRRCLESAVRADGPIVYVDSGSTDDSVRMVRAMGVHVIELNSNVRFSAARARNAGFDKLVELDPSLKNVMFVDGDCEIVEGWLPRSVRELESRQDTAVVCGRRRERYPDATIYNRVCDMEWNSRVGQTKSCGGDSVMRVDAFRQAGGFNPSVVAGEEPELCVRIRSHGWKIIRIDADMTIHDVAMTHFSQWWRRSVRSGHAYAQAVAMHGGRPEYHSVRQSVGIWFWAFALPLVAVGMAWMTRGWSALLLAGYPVLMAKIVRYRRRRGDPSADAWLYALFTTLMKWPQLIGQITYWWKHLRGREIGIIEYKGPEVCEPERSAPATAGGA